jgi:hypothetical protein
MTVDRALLAVSDVLVLKVLERAATYGPRSRRAATQPERRHVAYERCPVPLDKLDPVLRDMWVLCPKLAHRHGLDVDIEAWMALLDQYVRVLLMMGQPHTPEGLSAVLAQVPPWTVKVAHATG